MSDWTTAQQIKQTGEAETDKKIKNKHCSFTHTDINEEELVKQNYDSSRDMLELRERGGGKGVANEGIQKGSKQRKDWGCWAPVSQNHMTNSTDDVNSIINNMYRTTLPIRAKQYPNVHELPDVTGFRNKL